MHDITEDVGYLLKYFCYSNKVILYKRKAIQTLTKLYSLNIYNVIHIIVVLS